MRRAVIGVIVLALSGAVFLACQDPGSQADPTLGSLKITLDTAADKSVSGAKAILSSVTTVQLKLSSDEFPSVLASAVFVPAGTTLTVYNVKSGIWTAQVYLNDATGKTEYYGEGNVTVQPGLTASTSIRVYRTGTVSITLAEGIVAPTFTPDATTINFATKTLSVKIVVPAITGAKIAYSSYSYGATPVDPTTTTTYSVDQTVPIGFTDTLKAITVMTDNTVSPIAVFNYQQPYFNPGAGSYTGYTAVTIKSMLTGVTIRYTTDGSDPTYEYGQIAGNNSTVTLTNATSVLKAVSYTAGLPGSVSAISSATYTLNLAPIIQVYQVSTSVYTSGTSSYDFGYIAPLSQSSAVPFTIKNVGNGADLLLTGVALGGSNPGKYVLSTTGTLMTVPLGQTTQFTVAFAPTAGGAVPGTTVVISSNSSTNPSFSFGVTGTGNTAPTLSFLTGLDVQAAGTPNVNGIFQSVTSSHNYPVYKHLTANYWIYYEYDSVSGNPYYQRYLLGDSSSFAGDGSDSSSFPYTYGHTRMYVKSGSLTSPLGTPDASSDGWISPFSFGSAPYVSNANGIGGYLKVNRTLTAYYQYQDNESDAQSGTTFQWYQGTSSSGPWTAISGATNQTYQLQSNEGNKYMAVDVTPRSSGGVQIGTTQRSTTTSAVSP